VLQVLVTSVCYKCVLQGCVTSVCCKCVLQVCVTSVCYKRVLQELQSPWRWRLNQGVSHPKRHLGETIHIDFIFIFFGSDL